MIGAKRSFLCEHPVNLEILWIILTYFLPIFCPRGYTAKYSPLFEALARLNHYLRSSGSDVTVIAFIIFPTKNTSFNNESLKGHAISKSLQETVNEVKAKIGRKLYESCSRGELPGGGDLISRDDISKLKRVVLAGGQRSSW